MSMPNRTALLQHDTINWCDDDDYVIKLVYVPNE